MACSTIVQACLASRRHLPACTPPEPLEHLHGLNLLELTGSQSKAARALAMHQSTVCRSAALMGEQFRLQPRRGTGVLRYGNNESLELLRLSYRAHRLMDGQLSGCATVSWPYPWAQACRIQAGSRRRDWSSIPTSRLCWSSSGCCCRRGGCSAAGRPAI